MSKAALRRYRRAGERERTAAAVKAALPNDHQKGKRNSRYGVAVSDETKQKISLAQKRRLSPPAKKEN
jgi:hypothetical protein